MSKDELGKFQSFTAKVVVGISYLTLIKIKYRSECLLNIEIIGSLFKTHFVTKDIVAVVDPAMAIFFIPYFSKSRGHGPHSPF